MDLRQQIREHIIEQLLHGEEPEGFDDDYNLIDAGIMDSLAIMNMVTYFEQQAGIEFGDEDIVPEHFNSIDALASFAEQKRAG
jgi:acyl carrier protein